MLGQRASRSREAGEPRKPTVLRRTVGIGSLDLPGLFAFHDLLLMLVVRDVKVRYRQTLLGVAWVVFQPAASAAVLGIIFGRVANLPTEGQPPFLFAFAGLVCWGTFAGALTRSSASLHSNTQLITRAYFPRLILPAASVGSALVDSAVSLVVLFAVTILHGLTPPWSIVTLPIWAALAAMLALGVGLVFAALSVRFRDVQLVLPTLLQIGLLATPVAYSTQALPGPLRIAAYLNPLAGLVEAFRWSVLGGVNRPPSWALLYCAVVPPIVLVVGALVFRRLERTFADVI